MPAANVRFVVRHLGTPADPPTDADLVTAFAARRDQAAFAELVRRHGPTVFGACRRVLGDSHDAEDAFQAVFLVLARKVEAIRPPGAVGGWLYGVAVRTANKARVAATRRRRREMIAATAEASRERPRPEASPEDAELRSVLDAELARLPETVRAVIVLCDLHGRTRAEAAAELGCPEGTVAARLHRGRKKLGEALARRGLTLPAAGLVAVLAPEHVSAALTQATFPVATGLASSAVQALAREVIRSMTTSLHAFALGVVTLLAGGLLAAGLSGSSEPNTEPPKPPAASGEPGAAATGAPDGQPARAGGWKESKVLDLDGWLGGSVAYSADGKTLYVGGTDGHVRAYEEATWKQLWESKEGGKLAAVAVSADGKTLAVTTKDGVSFLDAATGKAGDKLEQKGSEPLTVAWFPNEVVAPGVSARKVIFGSARGYFVKTWLEWPMVSTIESNTIPEEKIPADEYAVPLAVSPDGKRVVVTGPIDQKTSKNVLWAWSAGSGAGNKLLEGHKAAVVSAAWSKDGKWIVTGDAGGAIIVWDAETFKEKSRVAVHGRIAAVAVSSGAAQPAKADKPDVGDPQGKVMRRRDGNIEINLGTDAGIRVGQTFIVLPADFPDKGVQSRMRVFRVPDESGGFKNVERFVEKATIEVTEVLGPKMSICRITKESDPIRDGAAAGELLYTPIGIGGNYQIAAAAVSQLEGLPGREVYSEDVYVWSADNPPKQAKAISRNTAGGPFQGVASLAFASDGKTLVSGFANFTHLTRTGELAGKVRVFTVDAQKPKPVEKPVSHVEFAPDGKRYLALAGGKADVFDSATGRKLYSVEAEGARFTADGKKLVAMGPKAVNFHDVATGQITDSHNRPKSNVVWRLVAFSADGKRYAVDSGSWTAVYDTATGKELARLDGRSELIGYIIDPPGESLTFSPDGKLVALVGVQRTKDGQLSAAVWDAETGKRIHTAEGKPDDVARAAAFTPDGDRLAIGFKDRVEVWIVRGDAKKNPERTFRTDDPVTALAFSKDGKQLAVGLRKATYHRWWADVRHSYKGAVQILDAASGEKLWAFDRFRPDSILVVGGKVVDPEVRHDGVWFDPLVTAMAFSSDGKALLAATGLPGGDGIPVEAAKPGELKVFDLTAPPPKEDPAAPEQKWIDAAVLTDHGRLVNGVAIAPDGKSFAAATDGNVTCWDATTRKVLWTHKTGGPFHAVVFAGDSKSAFAAGKAEVVRLDVATGEAGDLFGGAKGVAADNARHALKELRTRALALSADGKQLAGSDGYTAWAVEPATADRRGSVVYAGGDPKDGKVVPVGVAWSADGKRLAWINPKYEKRTVPSGLSKLDTHWPVRVWTIGAAGPFGVLAGHDAPVTAVAWSRDGKLIVSGDEKGTVIAWDPATEKELWRKKYGDGVGRVHSLAISPEDNTVAVGVGLGARKSPERVVLLGGKNGVEFQHLLRDGTIPIATVAWSSDGKFLVTGSGSAGRAIKQSDTITGEVVVWERKP